MFDLPPSRQVVMMPFDKGAHALVLGTFEKQLMFGVQYLLKYFSPLALAMAPGGLALPTPYFQEGHVGQLQTLASELQTHFLCYGAFRPQINDAGYLESLAIDVFLYDFEHNRHGFKQTFVFNQFASMTPKLNNFQPDWLAFQRLIRWVAAELIAALYSEHSILFLPQLVFGSLGHQFATFEKLSTGHYLNMDTGLSQRLSLYFGVSHDEDEWFFPHLELGHLYKRLGSYPEALVSLSRAFERMGQVSPRQRAICATEIGVVYALINNYGEARHWWELAIKQDAKHVNPYLNLAHHLEEQGDIEGAEEFFLRVADITPEDSRVYFNLARLYSKREQWDKVLQQYEHQEYLEPDNPWVYSNIANCYLNLGDLSKAKSYLLRTLELDPHGEAGKVADYILANLAEGNIEASFSSELSN